MGWRVTAISSGRMALTTQASSQTTRRMEREPFSTLTETSSSVIGWKKERRAMESTTTYLVVDLSKIMWERMKAGSKGVCQRGKANTLRVHRGGKFSRASTKEER